MTDKVKVTELTTTYTKGADRFGPFKASKEQPFLEVPISIALASGAPVYDGEAAQAEQEAEGEGTDVQVILKANQDLKADLDKVTGERDRLNGDLAHLRKEQEKLADRLTAAQARIAELEAATPLSPTLEGQQSPQSPEQGDTATPLVDGLQHADLLMAAGITSMEALEAGLIVPEGEKVSPVEAVDGIGKKTVEAYTKAVADWRKGQGQQ